ncbi:MAG: phosphate-starvation-inducible PsiE family protein [Desulfatibacillaceae bacterium]
MANDNHDDNGHGTGRPNGLNVEGSFNSFCIYKPEEEPVIIWTHRIILVVVRIMAVLMTGVIIMGIADVVYTLYKHLMSEPRYILDLSNILMTFGTFLAVLIAIEIYTNIVLYLREEVIHLKLVLATALMAAARKVIVLDFDKVSHHYVWAIAIVILALACSYWLVVVWPAGNGNRGGKED